MSRSWIYVVEEHEIIRDTVGYDFISKLDIVDVPPILDFLRIVSNYKKMQLIKIINNIS